MLIPMQTMKSAMRQAPLGRATGPDSIAAEMLKHGGDNGEGGGSKEESECDDDVGGDRQQQADLTRPEEAQAAPGEDAEHLRNLSVDLSSFLPSPVQS